jgi:broad specificity phosphatase PhoE
MGIVLILIAHGPTAATRRAAFAADEPLEPGALRRLGAVADGPGRIDAMAGGWGPYDRALTAPELRARQTADALQMAYAVDPALRDIDLGRWAGRDLAEVQAAEPEAVAAWIRQPDASPHGGESVAGLLRRIAPWLEAMNEGTERVVAVTHPAVIRAAMTLAIGAGPASFWRIDAGPLCRVRLSGDGKRWNLQGFSALSTAAPESV